MRNMKGALIFAVVLAVILASGTSAAEETDVRHIPPNVMLLLDTSGSMEFTRVYHVTPECKGDPALDDEQKRTRWMMVLDALLGPVYDEEYACRRIYPGESEMFYEYGIDKTMSIAVPEEHVIPHFIALGRRDVTYGILERYREFVRFGMATYDSFSDDETNEDGMWSYGPLHIDMNLGIKLEEESSGGVQEDVVPGALVSWGPDTESMDMTNFRVRRELTQVVPYCGSPLAAALDDVEFFMRYDPDNKAPRDDGFDRYYECRERLVILIADEKPKETRRGEMVWFGTVFQEAADLWNLSQRAPLYVLWIPRCPHDENPGSEWSSSKTMMDQIANAGCPPTDIKCPEGAYPIENMKDIMEALEDILYRTMSNAVSRTVALTTNVVGPRAAPGVMQYQFNTSFIPHKDAPWEGVLERSSYICNAADEIELTTSDYLDYGERLDSRTGTRKIYTAVSSLTKDSGTELDEFETTNPLITPAVLGEPSEDATWVDGIIDFMHGRNNSARDPDSSDEGHRLADPFHASAAMVGPPVADLPFVSYYQYQADEHDRVPVIFLATNQGMIHAFRVQDTGNSDEKGEELWSYIPGTMLPRIAHQVPKTHIWGVDSTPMTGDIRLFKDDDSDTNDEEWMAVLVGGFRQGGYGYYALDVTDPDDPEFLWEISPRKPGFENLKESYATPMLGTVFTEHPSIGSNPLGEIAVVIVPGGFNPATREGNTGLYVLTADEGVVLRELQPEFPAALGCGPSPDCGAHPECCAQMITSPVGFSSMPGYLTTRVFVGDDRGRVWRADLSSKDTDDWRLDLFYPVMKDKDQAPYTVGEPVESPVGLGMNTDGKLVVIFGTGNVDDLTGMGRNYIFSLTEEVEYDGAEGTYTGKPKLNWTIELQEGEKLLGQPAIFNETAYFTTFVPYTDPSDLCKFGAGRIWGVHYMSKDPNEDGDTSDFARLDADEIPDGSGDLRTYLEYENTIISGLTVVQRPSCLGIDPMTGLPLNAGAQEVYEIVAQASGGQGVNEGRRKTPTITMRIPGPTYRNLATSWGSLIQ